QLPRGHHDGEGRQIPPAAIAQGLLDMSTCSRVLAEWTRSVRFEDLPDDVVETTKLRILDVIGLALAGLGTAYGTSVRAAAVAMSPPGPSRIFGSGDRVAVATAAFANGALPQAMEYDDTPNES